MPRVVFLALAFVLVAAAPAAAAPAKNLKLGIGEQDPAFFADERWQALDSPHVRVVVAWDALKSEWETAELDWWMQAAQAAGAKPLVTFGHARETRVKYLPTRDQFARQFRRFLLRYPDQKLFQVWNEANHGTQPTARRPDRAARFYDAMRLNCPSCTIAAPSVLDMQNMVPWIQEFRREARGKVRIWSLHNHIDANRHQQTGTKELLRNTRGQVWFTETGGIARRWIGRRKVRRYTVRNAARATRNVFRLAALSPRVKRIYFYHWIAPAEKRPRWDSAFFTANGTARPAYAVLKREVRRAAR